MHHRKYHPRWWQITSPSFRKSNSEVARPNNTSLDLWACGLSLSDIGQTAATWESCPISGYESAAISKRSPTHRLLETAKSRPFRDETALGVYQLLTRSRSMMELATATRTQTSQQSRSSVGTRRRRTDAFSPGKNVLAAAKTYCDAIGIPPRNCLESHPSLRATLELACEQQTCR